MTTTATNNGAENMTYQVLGTISAERPCDCCGNTQLEKSVVLKDTDGQITHVGCDCACKLLNGRKGKGRKYLLRSAQAISRALTADTLKRATDYVWLITGNPVHVDTVRQQWGK